MLRGQREASSSKDLHASILTQSLEDRNMKALKKNPELQSVLRLKPVSYIDVAGPSLMDGQAPLCCKSHLKQSVLLLCVSNSIQGYGLSLLH